MDQWKKAIEYFKRLSRNCGMILRISLNFKRIVKFSPYR